MTESSQIHQSWLIRVRTLNNLTLVRVSFQRSKTRPLSHSLEPQTPFLRFVLLHEHLAGTKDISSPPRIEQFSLFFSFSSHSMSQSYPCQSNVQSAFRSAPVNG
ncbi:hypothetical protein L596_027727 [Steinernema carpocapsae]|uniref:Uncharacterized protein n=1 Tax=Steinernema carpocapsae TaxID=34508 RepID=A0A4U5LWD7_STECR|nr:hypothetical protein L596_027727 [Steinernema carpocapsae]